MEIQETHFEKLVVNLPPYTHAELENVTWTPYGDDPDYAAYDESGNNGYLVGTVVKGSTTNRLFGVVSRTEWEVGKIQRFDFCSITRIRNGEYYNHSC